jgi:hypothetical protein
MSPDSAAKPEAVPYSDLSNPQSLNLYVYVNNNPLINTDPNGHELLTGLWNVNLFTAGNIEYPGPQNSLFPSIAGTGLTGAFAWQSFMAQQNGGEGSASNLQKREALATAAGQEYHSTKLNPKGGYSQCNVFVCAMIDKVGLDGPGNGNGHAITAGQWADPKFAIDNWRVLGANEAAAPGDVAAVAMPSAFSNASGHMGIVSDLEGGVPHIMAAGSQHVYRTLAANFEPDYTIVYRRHVGP